MNHLSPFQLFLRSIFKYFTHLFTGQSEIQRIARLHDINALQTSIQLSKVLVNYRNSHCDWKEPYNHQLLEELCALKNITDSDSKFRVGIVLNQLHSWKHAVRVINDFKSVKYNSENQGHEQKLLQIWNRLRPLRQLKARRSQEWIQIGFQAEDPATDFRGSGQLGLVNLYELVGKQEGKSYFHIADTKGTDYFFASASIYLTMLTFQIVKDLKIPANFWVGVAERNILIQFQKLYEYIFKTFNTYWFEVVDKSMMQFNSNLIAFSKRVKQGTIMTTICNEIIQNRQ